MASPQKPMGKWAFYGLVVESPGAMHPVRKEGSAEVLQRIEGLPRTL